MKQIQLKDALRNIWKQKISFLSIVVIATLGVTMFLGIDFSASAIWKNATAFYNEKNYRDIEAVSTLLLSEDDLSAIRSTEGVRDAEGIYVVSAKASANDARTNVDVLSLTERINLPTVYEGRLPAADTECAIEQKIADALELKIGDTVAVSNVASNVSQYFAQRSFVITGIVLHPDHICNNVPTTPYIMVTPDVFDVELLDGCYMKAEIVTDRAANASRFDSAYNKTVSAVMKRLEDLSLTRAPIRETEVDEQVHDAIAGYREKLKDAEQQLKDARTQLDQGYLDLQDGEQQYADGEQKLKDARAELDDAKQQLVDGEQEQKDARAKLDDAKAELEAGKEELDAGKAQLDSARAQLVSGWNQLEDAKEQIRTYLRDAVEFTFGSDVAESIEWAKRRGAYPDSRGASAKELWITETYKIELNTSKTVKERIEAFAQLDVIPEKVLIAIYDYAYPDSEYDEQAARSYLADTLYAGIEPYADGYTQLLNGCARWNNGHRSYLKGKAQYEEGLAKYEKGLEAYNEGEEQYAAGLQAYEEGLKDYNDGETKYEQGVLDLEEARGQLEDARQQLSDGEAQYTDGLQQYEDGKARLEAAEEQLSSLGVCKWILLNTSGNASFTQIDTAGGNLKSMEMTFSLMFVLVGALVIYATISKMVDEQRSLVGTTKALGFFNTEIFTKYLLFGVSATVIGTILGLILAVTMIETFALGGYNTYFNIDLTPHTVKLLPTVLVFLAGILLAFAAIWFATQKLLRESAIRLMQQAVPKGSKKTAAVKKHLLSLYSRLILLNIRTDLRRVIVTIVSVAGCCALVVVGITLRNAVEGAEKKQYDEIVRHDGTVWFDADANADAAEEIEACIAQAGADSVPVMHTYVTVKIKNLDLQELYCGDLTAISELYALMDAKTGETITPVNDGIYVTKRFSENYGVQAGDVFELSLNGTETVEVRVADVFDNYMNRYLFMSDPYYEKLFGKNAVPNGYYVRLNGVDSEALCQSLQSISGYMSYDAADTTRALFRSATAVLNGIVLLFIGMAGIMAGVVLMNLTNIYIMQKKRELTIMRINGFTVREVIGYVLRETVLTTSIGILLGIGLGSGIGYKIVRSMEQSFIQFVRSVSPIAWLIGAAITVVFTVLVNLVALKKVKHLKLTDI